MYRVYIATDGEVDSVIGDVWSENITDVIEFVCEYIKELGADKAFLLSNNLSTDSNYAVIYVFGTKNSFIIEKLFS